MMRYSKRIKLLSEEPELDPNAINSTGICALPDELLLEILAEFAIAPPESDVIFVDSGEHALRRNAILSISQTCSRFRRFFKPYIWERIDVVSGVPILENGVYKKTLDWAHADTAEKRKVFASELLRQLETVTIRDPSLAQCIRVVNIQLTNYAVANIVKELVRCLRLFPNLRTLSVKTYRPSEAMRGDVPSVRTAFRKALTKKLTFPKVHTMTVSEGTSSLVKCCPNVKTLGWFDAPLLQSLKNPGIVECLVSVVVDQEGISTISRYCPSIQDITIQLFRDANLGGAFKMINAAMSLVWLRTLRIHVTNAKTPPDSYKTDFPPQQDLSAPKAKHWDPLRWTYHADALLSHAQAKFNRPRHRYNGLRRIVLDKIDRYTSKSEQHLELIIPARKESN